MLTVKPLASHREMFTADLTVLWIWTSVLDRAEPIFTLLCLNVNETDEMVLCFIA